MKFISEKVVPLILCLLVVCSLISIRADAAGAIDPDRNVIMEINYEYEDTPISDVEFTVYYVASVSAEGDFTLAEPFDRYPVAIEGLDAEGWNALALTLKGYVQSEKLSPVDSGKTGADGRLVFPQQSNVMKPGLYLVLGKNITQNGAVYAAAPFLVCLPGLDAEANTWDYHVTVKPKTDRNDAPMLHCKVLKVWDDKGHEAQRPQEIHVRLLRNGEVQARVTLNQANNWRYTWENLDAQDEWLVVEEETAQYTVKTEQQGSTFVLTNTYKSPTPEGTTTSRTVNKIWDDKGYEKKRPSSITVILLKNGTDYDKQSLTAETGWKYRWEKLPIYDETGKEIEWSIREGVVSGYSSSVSVNQDRFTLTNTVDKSRLPQTGVLWWPVPILVLTGLVFLSVGFFVYKRKKHE